ncbi:MAG: SDR family oxidoreductase [Chloroflexi bacterium]|nr:SDR family oxidoreductase [Chloroflexota bacterium]
MPNLNGQVALVTGAARGIGRAIALALAEDGADVAVFDILSDPLKEVEGEIKSRGGRAVAGQGDVSREEDVTKFVASVEQTLRPIDILVNNAGIGHSADTWSLPASEWQRTIQVNLTGAFLFSKAVIPGMISRRRGRIINIASTGGKVGWPKAAAYNASKHGLLGLTKSLAMELVEYGITVNAICPSWVMTEMAMQTAREIAASGGMSIEQALENMASTLPQKRIIAPEEVARLAVMLARPDSQAINGAAINIDGGSVPY